MDDSRRSNRPLSVLVVDDDPDTADSLAALLGLAGHRARAAYSAAEALAAAVAEPPDVVLLDLWMPGVSGYQVARQLRAADKPPLMVAVTGCGTQDDRRRSGEAGFHLHLLKPVAPDVVLGVLARFGRLIAPATVG
jgi:CheY-like chemotaxis protein